MQKLKWYGTQQPLRESIQLPNGELNPVVSVLQGVLHSLQPYDVPSLYIRDLQQDKRQTLESRQLHQTPCKPLIFQGLSFYIRI